VKKIFYIIIFILNFNNLLATESKIIYKIENEIITNVDIKNEYKYLLALNNNLNKLSKEKVFTIAKNSIIKEKIKKIELTRNFVNFDLESDYLDQLIKNIYFKLNLKSVKDFKEYLKIHNLKMGTIREKVTIDALWNALIIKKYNSKIEIDLEKIKNNIDNRIPLTKSYLLSEIVFEIKDKKNLKSKYNEILKSIEEVGFKNTVSIYSISDSNKSGGNIGWIDATSLNNKIKEKINSINVGEVSSPIMVPGGILVLKVNEIKEELKEINFKLEFEEAVIFERNKQLNQYSKIYFNKTKKNLKIDEY
jgi:peptidyl-prolyl cis-trans isomerase SurA